MVGIADDCMHMAASFTSQSESRTMTRGDPSQSATCLALMLCNVASDGELHTAVVDGASLVNLTFFTNLSILSEPYKHVRKAAVITTSCSYSI